MLLQTSYKWRKKIRNSVNWWKVLKSKSCNILLSPNQYTKYEKVQVGKDQEKAQSEKDSHSKNRGGKN